MSTSPSWMRSASRAGARGDEQSEGSPGRCRGESARRQIRLLHSRSMAAGIAVSGQRLGCEAERPWPGRNSPPPIRTRSAAAADAWWDYAASVTGQPSGPCPSARGGPLPAGRCIICRAKRRIAAAANTADGGSLKPLHTTISINLAFLRWANKFPKADSSPLCC